MPNTGKPQFSIIIPLYNKEDYIKRALSSALNQTIQDFEIIIVNDASTDKSLDRVKEMKDERIRIFHRQEPGPGGYAARNLGIHHAAGDYISFLDADDEWLPCYLEEIAGLVQKYPNADGFFTGYVSIFADGKKITNIFSLVNRHWKTKYISREELFLSVARGMSPVLTSCFTVRKPVIMKAGGFPEGKCSKGGDVETWMRIGLSCDFAWSSYRGLNYYRDISNQVTAIHSGAMVPYVYYSAKDLLGRLDPGQGILVKKYVNYYIKWNIKRSIITNQVVKELLYAYFKEVDMVVYLLYRLMYCIPVPVRTGIYKMYNLFKRVIGSKKKKQIQ